MSQLVEDIDADVRVAEAVAISLRAQRLGVGGSSDSASWDSPADLWRGARVVARDFRYDDALQRVCPRVVVAAAAAASRAHASFRIGSTAGATPRIGRRGTRERPTTGETRTWRRRRSTASSAASRSSTRATRRGRIETPSSGSARHRRYARRPDAIASRRFLAAALVKNDMQTPFRAADVAAGAATNFMVPSPLCVSVERAYS